MNLSILQFNEVNISTRITTGVLNHQFLRRPYKEHFYKCNNFLPLACVFNFDSCEIRGIADNGGIAVSWGISIPSAGCRCKLMNENYNLNIILIANLSTWN